MPDEEPFFVVGARPPKMPTSHMMPLHLLAYILFPIVKHRVLCTGGFHPRMAAEVTRLPAVTTVAGSHYGCRQLSLLC